MTLNEMLGSVVHQLQSQEQDLNAADPQHPTHGTDLLAKFQAAQAAAPTDPNADLGEAFAQASSAISGQGGGFTSKAYGDAFSTGAQAFAGRPNQLSANDIGPIIGALTQGFANHDTRGVNAAGPLGALGPLLGMLTGGGNQGGGIDLGSLAGSLLGGGQQGGQGGGLGGLLGGLMGGSQGGGLGNILGGLLGGGQAQQPQAQASSGGMGDILGQLMGAARQGTQMTGANGTRDAGASSTSAVLEGILGAFMRR
jgi:hypothetical protein